MNESSFLPRVVCALIGAAIAVGCGGSTDSTQGTGGGDSGSSTQGTGGGDSGSSTQGTGGGDSGSSERACAPESLLGTWSLSGEPVGDGCHGASIGYMVIEVSQGSEGVEFRLTGFPPKRDFFDAATCTLELSVSSFEEYEQEPHESSYDIELTFNGSAATGTMTSCVAWTCDDYPCAEGDWELTATRR